jgi:hypothetical protein
LTVPVPQGLLRGLFPVDGELLVARYRAALEALGSNAGQRSRFHIDAAGYSPEIAADLADPHYLRSGVLHAHAVIVSAEQLRAPLIHPSLGYAADAYRQVTRKASQEIARIMLREPLLGEIRQAASHLTTTQQLADLSKFELHFRTPGGLVRGARKLEEMKAEFLESTQRWLDDDFIHELKELARDVRDVGALPDHLVVSRHSLGLFYSPAFGGSYVLEEAGASARNATTHVLCAEPETGEGASDGTEYRSARGRRVAVERLDAASAAAALERHGIVRLDWKALRRDDAIARVQHWIAVDYLLDRDPDRLPSAGTPTEVLAEMRAVADPPAEYLELADVARRLAGSAKPPEPDSLSAITRLRLLKPASAREDVSRFVAHLQAFVDPLHLGRWWRDAPDVFFSRLPELSREKSAYFARWLDEGSRSPQ